MHPYLSLLVISGSLALGAMSPGPTFIVVAKNAISLSRRHGFATALGSGLGACLYALIALFGLHAVFRAVPLVFWVFKVVGGLYLIYLATQILRHASQPLAAGDGLKRGTTLWQAFRFGLATQASNPKTAMFFAGIFSALLPQQIPAYFFLVLPAVAWAIDTGWYFTVAFLLSSEGPRNAYLRFKTVIDRTCGSVLALLGAKLVISQ
jgi:threonine/homoserine/homoserine lactone efflux protein